MDNKTIGVVFALMGIVTFLYSFGATAAQPKVYFWVGLGLIIGGLLFAKYAKD